MSLFSRYFVPLVVTVVFNGWMYNAVDKSEQLRDREAESAYEDQERREDIREERFRNSILAMKKQVEEMEKKRKCWIV